MDEVQFHPLAEHEFAEAFEFYYYQQVELSQRFEAAIDRALSEVIAQPDSCPQIDSRHYRKLVEKPFPYSLIYRIDKGAISVIAVAHHRRRPMYWVRR